MREANTNKIIMWSIGEVQLLKQVPQILLWEILTIVLGAFFKKFKEEILS